MLHSKELVSPKQTALGKDFSNPLMDDSLPKTIWLSIHLVVYIEELAIPRQTITGKESSNPFMAGSLPKTIHFCDSLQSDKDSFKLIELIILGRIDIGDIDTDAEITLIDETQGRINDIVADEDITLIPKLIIKQLKM
ncbi:hypothetical protein Tco_0928906 [Tanacetum coccineum]